MKAFLLMLIAVVSLPPQSEPVVSKDSISIHTVHRGNMRLRLILGGEIVSIEPARSVVYGPLAAAGFLRIGQALNFEIQGRRNSAGSLPVISGKVTRLGGNNSTDSIRVEADLSGPVPEGTAVGTRIGALLDTGEEL